MKIKKILYPTDLTDCASLANEYVIFLAKKHKATVSILYVDEATYLLNPMSPYAETDLTILSSQVQRVASEQVRELVRKSFPKDVVVEAFHRIGRPYQEIIDMAAEKKTDLIVMGTHGHSGLNIILGSNAERIARLASCPVLTVGRKNHFDGFHRVIFPVDFSALCKSMLFEAIDFVRAQGSELRLLHVASNKDAPDEILNNQFAEFLSKVDTSGMIFKTCIVRADSPTKGILDYSVQNEGDLIVIGSHGRTGLQKILLGSVATDVLNRSPVPVMVLRAFSGKPGKNGSQQQTSKAVVKN